MAGDWVKIEHVSPDKPEVIAMAETLKIDQDAVFGKLVRLWIWADQQTIIGDAASVTHSFIDRCAGVANFATAMVSAGWLRVENGVLTFPNFDRHNGITAKTRALTNKRTKRWRDAANVTKSSPEKRREEKNLGGGKGGESEVALEMLGRWNAIAGVAPAKSITPKRLAAILRVAKTPWSEAMSRVALCSFCTGGGDKGWVADFDWFLKPDTVNKILEGKYDERTRKIDPRGNVSAADSYLRKRHGPGQRGTNGEAIDVACRSLLPPAE